MHIGPRYSTLSHSISVSLSSYFVPYILCNDVISICGAVVQSAVQLLVLASACQSAGRNLEGPGQIEMHSRQHNLPSPGLTHGMFTYGSSITNTLLLGIQQPSVFNAQPRSVRSSSQRNSAWQSALQRPKRPWS
jgi:hypothetical protein